MRHSNLISCDELVNCAQKKNFDRNILFLKIIGNSSNKNWRGNIKARTASMRINYLSGKVLLLDIKLNAGAYSFYFIFTHAGLTNLPFSEVRFMAQGLRFTMMVL